MSTNRKLLPLPGDWCEERKFGALYLQVREAVRLDTLDPPRFLALVSDGVWWLWTLGDADGYDTQAEASQCLQAFVDQCERNKTS